MSSQWTFEGSSSFRQLLALKALERAIETNKPAIVKQRIDSGVDVNALTPGRKLTPLRLALEMRSLSVMQQLLDGGAETERKGANGATVLIDACRMGYLDGVKLLVERGANLNAQCCDGTTCLIVALDYGHPSVVAHLLEQDTCKVNYRGRDGRCFLQRVVLADDAQLISKLKNRRIDLNRRSPDDTFPVFFATMHCKNNSLKGLLEAGANPNIGTMDGRYALREAMEQNDIDAVKHLMKHGADTRMGGLTPIDATLKNKWLPMLTLLLDYGTNIEQAGTCGSTPLIAACSVGYLEAVQLLVERGANMKAHTREGDTCLLVALTLKHDSIVDYLLDQEVCEVNKIGKDGYSALHFAVRLKNVGWVRRLLQKQADVNVQSHKGEVPVLVATKHNALNLMRMLLEAGADPNIITKDGESALHEAVKQRSVEAVKLLLQHGADRNRCNKRGITPVQVAMALVPPPQDIIHCLLTDLVEEQKPEMSPATADNVEDKKKIFDSEAEQSLCCPITFEIMKDPVIAMDGHTYERKAIERWIREKKQSPVTRQPMTSSTLIPNHAIRHLIDQFKNMDSNA